MSGCPVLGKCDHDIEEGVCSEQIYEIFKSEGVSVYKVGRGNIVVKGVEEENANHYDKHSVLKLVVYGDPCAGMFGETGEELWISAYRGGIDDIISVIRRQTLFSIHHEFSNRFGTSTDYALEVLENWIWLENQFSENKDPELLSLFNKLKRKIKKRKEEE